MMVILRSCAILLMAGTASLTAQTTVSVPCNLDNTLYEDSTGSVSNGAGNGIFVGFNVSGLRRRALVRFDLAGAVPANAKVISATLTVNAVMSIGASPAPLLVHRATQSWGEGTSVAQSPGGGGGGGAPSTANDATWVHRFFAGATWTTPGGDFVASPSFVLTLPGFGLAVSTPNAGANADVQHWIDNPGQNFGWLLKVDELLGSTARKLDSRESSGIPPTLSVTYLLPGQAANFGTGCPVGAGSFTNSWVGAPVGGTSIQLAQSAAPVNSIGALYFALDLEAGGLPLPLAGCTVYLPLPGLVAGPLVLTGPAGSSSAPFNVPVGFPGRLIVCQAAVLDANPLGFVVSDAAVACLQ